ncbi:MAG: sigma-70 family RNA polymerase sigma factor [bacterium]|nr:sigma-70 family RNA polymerase sigma factor [bacterium]
MRVTEVCLVRAIGRSRSQMATDDRELAAAARKGDEEAFASLVKKHSGGLHRAVARIVGDDAEGWDVVQLAFLRAWQRLDRYDSRWSFATWLYRIGTNLAIDLIRSRGSREKAHQAGGAHILRVVGRPSTPSDELAHGEVAGILDQLVESLSPQQRSAFVLREIEGLDSAEVAAVLGCSPTTVRNHIFQARKILRKKIEDQFPEYLPSARRDHNAV